MAAGDPVHVVAVPDHDLTVGFAFRAGTTRPDLLPALAGEPRLGRALRKRVEQYLARHG